MKLLLSVIFSFIFSTAMIAANSPMTQQQIIILLGAPASGKGTQAKFIVSQLQIPHISTGDLFRENIKNKTQLGQDAKHYIDKGELVPESLVLNMLFDRLSRPDTEKGYLLDGFPRTLLQAEAFDKFIGPNAPLTVINIEVPESIIYDRVAKRQAAEGRSDDTEDIAKERLKIYFAQTYPLIQYYKNKGVYHEVDGNRSIEEVKADIEKLLK